MVYTFPGHVNDSVPEKSINLEIALRLDTLLEETGAQMVMACHSDTTIN